MNRVYDDKALSPSLNTCQGGGRQPKICEIVAIDEQNITVRTETFGTLQTDGSSPKHNNRVCEVVAMRGRENGQQLEPNSEGICNTLTSAQKDNLILTAEAAGETPLAEQSRAEQSRAEQSRAERSYSASNEGWQHRAEDTWHCGSDVSNEQDKERKSDRRWKDLSHSYNGEYP